jgi:hypothetical protein
LSPTTETAQENFTLDCRRTGIRHIRPILILAAVLAPARAFAQVIQPAPHSEPASLTGQILAVILGIAVSGVCVLMHYEALRYLTTILARLDTRPRPRILILMISLIFVHQAEVWNFAWAYFFADMTGIMGTLLGGDRNILTYAYFSTTTYTTLGYGDITPTGPLRFLASVEALTGFLLVTWSASFTYLEMQRFWRDK